MAYTVLQQNLRKSLEKKTEVLLDIPRFTLIDQNSAIITHIGSVGGCILYPEDRILLDTRECSTSAPSNFQGMDGELILVQANHSSIQMLHPVPLFARKYGEYIVLEGRNALVLDEEKWTLLGVVKGIQRPLDNASLGQKHWHVRIFGLEDYVSEEGFSLSDRSILSERWVQYIEAEALAPEYLGELCKQLSSLDGVSVQAGWSEEALNHVSVPLPGYVVFSLYHQETASPFVASWAAASKRNQRRKRMSRRVFRTGYSMYPLPEALCHLYQESQKRSEGRLDLHGTHSGDGETMFEVETFKAESHKARASK